MFRTDPGVIEPGIEAALNATRGGRIGVIGYATAASFTMSPNAPQPTIGWDGCRSGIQSRASSLLQ